MSTENDTVAEEVTETESAEINGTASSEPTAESVAPVETDQEKVDRVAYEQLQKELNKTKQELNLQRNREQEAERKRLQESGEYKELADKLQAELDETKAEREAAERQKEAEDFRKGILDQYPEVKDAAESLNLWWDDPQDFTDAETQLKAKLNVLQAKLGSKPVQQDDEAVPEISANNPNLAPVDESEIAKLKKLSSDELKKILPVGDAR